ncbi:hypothetical protein [Paenibacillus sacheonensis]|uniref:Uncharacterized protein n=1 Tax=Paenibacillus sacheonensis TaxID=742054 RepID=A0A7X5BYQ6_9BACL|nr:hypothetical protein [Paenibacillus sacheonensis]MBM7568160.1 glycerol kinase [Paenibacillus sacheonensis]NBC71838.1 hypothetical protein [Paenibacillus sacheonensis]
MNGVRESAKGRIAWQSKTSPLGKRSGLRSLRRVERRFAPEMAAYIRDELYEGWQSAVRAALAFVK